MGIVNNEINEMNIKKILLHVEKKHTVYLQL